MAFCIGLCADESSPVAQQIEEQRRQLFQKWDEYRAATLALQRKILREESAAAMKLGIRERLERAATVSGELAALAEKRPPEALSRENRWLHFPSRTAIYPRASHVAKLIAVRCWLRDYADDVTQPRFRFLDEPAPRWLGIEHQDELRQMLKDDDPDIRVMAAEALAMLYDPEDLRLIREIFRSEDELAIPAIPTLSMHYAGGGQQGGGGFELPVHAPPDDADSVSFPVYWKQLTIGGYLDRTYRQLTGSDVTRDNVGDWTNQYGETTDSLWYWQYRFERTMNHAQKTLERSPLNYRYREADVAAVVERFRKELAAANRFVEAKVVLLMDYDRREARNRVLSIQDFRFRLPLKTRLTKDELFELLQGQLPSEFWDDVRWQNDPDRTKQIYNRLVTRILNLSTVTFTADDVPRLKRVLNARKSELYRNNKVQWHLQIAQLLPAANVEVVEDPGTRDGYLRTAVSQETNVFVASSLASELVRTGLANNREFLTELFFAGRDSSQARDGVDDVQLAILGALNSRQPTADQKAFLRSVVTDERFQSIWAHRPTETFYNGRGRGKSNRKDNRIKFRDHAARRMAIGLINAFSGKDLIDSSERVILRNPETSQATIEKILDRLKATQW